MKLLDDWRTCAYPKTNDDQHMAEEIIDVNVVLQWLRTLGSERLSGGSFREAVSTGIGEELLHEFSLASVMSWTRNKEIYERRFGQVPSWLMTVNPVHRTAICRIALERDQTLPQITETAALAAYQAGRDFSNAICMDPHLSEINVSQDTDKNIWHFEVSESGTPELRGDVDAANKVAINAGMPVRFKRIT